MYNFMDGRRYEGTFKDDARTGPGCFSSPKGESYQGDWEEDEKRSRHVGMGGQHLRDFAEGLSEQVCDRIVATVPGAAAG